VQKFLVKLIDIAEFLHSMPPLSLISRKMSSEVRIIFALEKAEGDAMTQDRRAIDTRLQHPRVAAAPGGEPVTSPIYQSSTYVLPTPELGAEIAASWHPQRFYTRYGSPNVAQVEALVAELEGAESAVAVGSGMAAIAAAIGAHVRAGDHVVAQTAHYIFGLSL
jgi:cystathionine beta-lyase/cystathionine gamma-synthase